VNGTDFFVNREIGTNRRVGEKEKSWEKERDIITQE
jgi:hypothetical protein